MSNSVMGPPLKRSASSSGISYTNSFSISSSVYSPSMYDWGDLKISCQLMWASHRPNRRALFPKSMTTNSFLFFSTRDPRPII